MRVLKHHSDVCLLHTNFNQVLFLDGGEDGHVVEAIGSELVRIKQTHE
jgi:hypothetical protein